MEKIDYFIPEGVSGQYFVCVPYGTLSVTACARNHGAAPRQVDKGRLGACIGCAIGARHAGESPSAALPGTTGKSPFQPHNFCVRCRRASTDVDLKLLGRMRLLRNKTICVSCYNREREVKAGRNAKGNAPRKWAHLMQARIAVVSDHGGGIVELRDPVYDKLEAVYTSLRAPGGTNISVGWASSSPVAMLEAVRS